MCYKELEKAALPHIAAYHNDLLVHDKEFIDENPGLPFLHFTGETGTHLFPFWKSEKFPKAGEEVKYLFGYADRERILESEMSVIPDMKTRYGRDKLAMYFDGKRLREISYKRATLLAFEYQTRLIQEWRKPFREKLEELMEAI